MFLQSQGIDYVREFQLATTGKKRFDFYFVWNERQYLVEIDGKQHFEFNLFFHKVEAKFLKCQQIDILKTQTAINERYFIVRIDFKSFETMESHLEKSLMLHASQAYYLSDAAMYAYITDCLK
jgi:hypothetical protein